MSNDEHPWIRLDSDTAADSRLMYLPERSAFWSGFRDGLLKWLPSFIAFLTGALVGVLLW